MTLFFLLETKGLTLEELDTLLSRAPYVVWFGRYRVNSEELIEQPLKKTTATEKQAAGERATNAEELPNKDLL